ncbi:MAG: hypothetical protein ACKV2O_24850 [Acidimicrobiales bacterium]
MAGSLEERRVIREAIVSRFDDPEWHLSGVSDENTENPYGRMVIELNVTTEDAVNKLAELVPADLVCVVLGVVNPGGVEVVPGGLTTQPSG